MNGEGLGVLEIIGGNNDGALGTVSDNDDTGTGSVRLGLRSESLGDANKILVSDTGRACP